MNLVEPSRQKILFKGKALKASGCCKYLAFVSPVPQPQDSWDELKIKDKASLMLMVGHGEEE